MRRALLIGSETGGLSGVHADVEVMGEALAGLGFTVMPATGKDATAQGIAAGYRELVEDSGPDDAVVVYYSGHGGRQRNPLAAQDPTLPTWLQYIVPTDFDNRSDNRSRCILAEELTRLQLELTDRTRNVTAILDCCHAARMSRSGSAVPKALEHLHLPEEDLVRRWREARAGRPLGGDANPHAVRLVACAPHQSAYELHDARLGRSHGVLTAALVRLLTGSDPGALTWLDVLESVRGAVPAAAAPQRPDVEGPADRLLFSLGTRGGQGVLPVRIKDSVAVLPDAAVFDVAVGDRYELVAPGDETPLAGAVVARISRGDAVLALEGVPDAAGLPPGVSAWPVGAVLGQRPVVVLPASHPGRDRIARELASSAQVRIVEETDDALATVSLEDEGDHDQAVHVADGMGQPLSGEAMPLDEAVEAVRTLALGSYVRRLPSGTGRSALPPDVEVQYLRLLSGGGEEELTHGAHLFVDDRLLVRITNRSGERRFVCLFDVGLAGALTWLTSSEQGGVTLEPGEQYELDYGWDGGIPLQWPEKLPAGQAREESFVAIVTDRPVDRLGLLGRAGRTRGIPPASNSLEWLVDRLDTGRRDVPAPPRRDGGVRWEVRPCDFLLHPARRASADEPTFEIDERPDESFRLVTPRGPDMPGRVAVRLKELTVHSNRAFLRSQVRIDALVVTAASDEAGGPYRAATLRFDRIKDGDRLPFDDVLVYEGPVNRFLDIAVWVARDDSPDVDLAEGMAAETGSEEVSTALTALAAAEPTAAVVAGSAAAVAILIRMAARMIDQSRGTSIGVYRTTLLPHQRFGVGDGVGRHPAQGLLRAQDMSLVFEVVDLSRG
ncbi:caspase family protein [Streptomyces sp. AC558_RSS880]|uniref:caspase family protein n=1 Tax=Streptomyces sp. AC558_RSS880 TaxID=2823687 RepID=UPI001C213145|nr:caspase family protein [Streptomyces sp. AC558_RSS880]